MSDINIRILMTTRNYQFIFVTNSVISGALALYLSIATATRKKNSPLFSTVLSNNNFITFLGE